MSAMTQTGTDKATTETVNFRTPAISCGACVATIERELRSLDGVSEAMASVETRLVAVEFDPAVQSSESLSTVLTSIGYPPQQ